MTLTFAWFSTHATTWTAALALMALAAAAIGSKHEDSKLLAGRPTTPLVAGCLGLCVAMHGMARVTPVAPWLFNMIYTHLIAALLIGLGATLLLLPGLRERGDLPGQPASIPIFEPTTLAALDKSKAKAKGQPATKAKAAAEEAGSEPEPEPEAESEPEPESESADEHEDKTADESSEVTS